MGKYFDIDENERYHSAKELQQKSGFPKMLNFTEKYQILEVQLREKGLRPYLYFDFSGFEIQRAGKKFMQQRGCHKKTLSKRAHEYMAWCEGKTIDQSKEKDYCR